MDKTWARFGSLLHGLPLIRNFGALTLSQAMASAIRFVYLVAVARLLGPEEVGIFVYGMALYLSLAGIGSFGQGILLSTRLGKSRHEAQRVISHSLTAVLAMTVLTTTAGLAFVWASEQEPRLIQAVALMALTIVPRCLVTWVRQCYVALEDASWIPRYEIVFRGGEALVGTAALFLWGDIRLVCAVHLSAWALEAMAAGRRLVKDGQLPLLPGRDRRLLKRIFWVSSYFMLSLFLLNVFLHVGILGLGILRHDSATVGYFGAAMQILAIFLMLPLIFGQAFLPSLSRGYRRGGAAPAVLTLVLKGLLVGGGFIAILADVYGPWLATALLGDRFASAGPVLAAISWALGPYAVILLAGQALNAIGGRNLATALGLSAVVVQAVLLVVLLPFGALAAATTAVVAAAWLGSLLAFGFIHRQLGTQGHGWWLRPLLAVAGTGAVMSFAIVPPLWTAPAATVLLVFLVWLLRIFGTGDFNLIRERLQAVAS